MVRNTCIPFITAKWSAYSRAHLHNMSDFCRTGTPNFHHVHRRRDSKHRCRNERWNAAFSCVPSLLLTVRKVFITRSKPAMWQTFDQSGWPEFLRYSGIEQYKTLSPYITRQAFKNQNTENLKMLKARHLTKTSLKTVRFSSDLESPKPLASLTAIGSSFQNPFS